MVKRFFKTIAELRVTLSDGTETVLTTDGSWQYRGSDFEMTDIYDGECLNRLFWVGFCMMVYEGFGTPGMSM